MRRFGLLLIAAVCLVIGAWVALLVLLPAAPATRDVRADRSNLVAPDGEAVLAMPVAGMPREALRDSWGDPRDNGMRAHHGTDIMAAPNTPVLAAAAGTVEKMWTSAAGGTTLYVRSPQRKWVYYYAHLSGYASGLHEGQVVKAGDKLGFVGDTGNAGAGNYHLHFGLARTTPAQRWHEGVDVDPYPYLAGPSIAGKPASR